MDYEAEAIQLFFVVIVLVAAYFGVMVWTRSVGNKNPGEDGGGGGLFGGFGGGGAESGQISSADGDTKDIDGLGVPVSRAEKNKGRFQLQGRDAEVAAKVLKRMLKQDAANGGE